MIYECSKCPVQFWIKLQKVQAETYPSIERLKRSLDSQNDQKSSQISKNLTNLNPESSSYISPIFSLQKIHKNKYNSHFHNKKRLLYHNYAKYKTIPFSYRNIFLPKEYSSSLIQELTSSIYQTVVQNKKNFCFLAFGSRDAETQNLIEGKQGTTQGVYFSSLIKLFDMVKNFNESTKFGDSTSLTYNINFVAVTQTKIIDLLNINNQIYVAEDPKAFFSQPLNFENATECSFTSSYQLYTTFKRVILRRKELKQWSIFVVKVNFYPSKTERNKKTVNNVLLIEWVKETKNFMALDHSRGHERNKSSFGEKSLLCLNQCILQLFKKVQIRNKQKNRKQNPVEQGSSKELYDQEEIQGLSNLQSFRKSLITRILKPYLLFNSQFVIMALCSINEQHQNDSYQTLMLGKHLSNLHSLSILQEAKPISTHKKFIEADVIMNCDEQSIDENVENYKAQNFQTIESVSHPESKRRHTKESKSFHESISNSPNKKPKTIKESSSQQELLALDSQNKQEKVRQKLLNLLEESKQKREFENGDKNQFKEISKKLFEEKQKSLKTKKQINMLKIKANTKNLKAKIIQKVQSDTQLLEQEIKRLNFDEKKIQKELQDLKEIIEAKISSINTSNKDQISSTDKRKEKLQKIKLLKSHLKNGLEITQMQINEFLEEKESIKSIYMHQINVLGHHQKQLIKKIQMQKNNSLYQKLQNSRDRKQLPKVRLSKQMQPFYKNSIGSQIRASLTIDRNQIIAGHSPEKNNQEYRYSTEPNQNNYKLPKTLSQKKKQSFESLDATQVQKLKQQRLLIRKRLDLKEKINKGKGQYVRFLQDTASKYLDYNPKRRQSTK